VLPLRSRAAGKPFIAISGLIGAGKTTLATALAKALDLPVYFEPVIDNVYLTDFYADMKKYSFQLQVYLLNKRFAQQQQIIWGGAGGVQDRSIYEDSVFARMLRNGGLMDQRDYDTYMSLFGHMSNFMKKPNMIVHLDVTPEKSLERIKLRSRGCETGVTIEYLQGLYEAYNEFISDISRVIPVIKVNWSEFQSAEDVAESIKDEYNKLTNVRQVEFMRSAPSTSPPSSPPSKQETKLANEAAAAAAAAAASTGAGAEKTDADGVQEAANALAELDTNGSSIKSTSPNGKAVQCSSPRAAASPPAAGEAAASAGN
jgi:deoxyadenosine kinase